MSVFAAPFFSNPDSLSLDQAENCGCPQGGRLLLPTTLPGGGHSGPAVLPSAPPAWL